MSGDKVSVIITAYNCQQSICKCIDSVLDQTYLDLEIIIVDDGSTDYTATYIDRYRNIKNVVCIHKENGGVSSARNKGIEIAKGRYIMFVDGDDTISPLIVERLIRECDEDTDIIACCCTVEMKNKRLEDHFYSGSFTAKGIEEKKKLFLQLLNMNYGQPQKAYTAIGVPWAKLYRGDFVQKNKLVFDQKLVRMQDNDFNLRAFVVANKIQYVDEALYNYNYNHVSGHISVSPDNRSTILKKRQVLLEDYSDDKEILTALNEEKLFFFIKTLDILGWDKIEQLIGEAPYNDILNFRILNVRGLYRKTILFLIKHGKYDKVGKAVKLKRTFVK